MTTATMNSISLLREQVKEAREFLEGTMADVTQEQSTRMPGGKAVSIAANGAHFERRSGVPVGQGGQVKMGRTV